MKVGSAQKIKMHALGHVPRKRDDERATGSISRRDETSRAYETESLASRLRLQRVTRRDDNDDDDDDDTRLSAFVRRGSGSIVSAAI